MKRMMVMNKRTMMMTTRNINLNKIKITRMITSNMMMWEMITIKIRKMTTTQHMKRKITMVMWKMTQINPSHLMWRDLASLYKSKTPTSLSISATPKNRILLISVKVIMQAI